MVRDRQLSVPFDEPTSDVLLEVAQYHAMTISDVIKDAVGDLLASDETPVSTDALLVRVRRRRTLDLKVSRGSRGPVKKFTKKHSSYLDESMLRQLDERCSRQKVKRAVFVRKAVDIYVTKPEYRRFVVTVATRYGKY